MLTVTTCIITTEPFTSYKIWVKAFSWKLEGKPSRVLEIRTDVLGPSAPYIVNLTCTSLDSLFLQWERPATYYNQIDYYFVYYRSEDSWEFEEIALSAGRDKIDHEVIKEEETTPLDATDAFLRFPPLDPDCEPDRGHAVRGEGAGRIAQHRRVIADLSRRLQRITKSGSAE